MRNIMKLINRVALVTGSAQGIGAAIREEFLKEGATVYGIDRAPQEHSHHDRFHELRVDLADHTVLQTIVEEIVSKEARLDILVNNAGISYYEELLFSSLEHWRHTQSVNIEAQYVLCRLVAPHMARGRWGRIVNIASTQAIATEPKVGAYAASKGAILSFTRSLAVELAPLGINANAIAPGCIHTPMSIINGIDETQTEYFQNWYVKERKIPLARPGDPTEIARVAVFLASEDASYVTGHTLVADGGLTITF
jgi:NAD(P)-dependent dehydrogenase (short-subunit alcohol dehydrogenase family)